LDEEDADAVSTIFSSREEEFFLALLLEPLFPLRLLLIDV
jgi:hypothetical protein